MIIMKALYLSKFNIGIIKKSISDKSLLKSSNKAPTFLKEIEEIFL